MDHVSSILSKVIKKRGLQGHADAALVVLHAQGWIDTALPGLRDQIKAKQFKDGVLTIEVQNSIAAQECQMQLEELHEHLRNSNNHDAISSIRIARSMGKKSPQTLASAD